MQNPLYFHGNQAVTMATGTVTMATTAWIVTMGETKMAESKMADPKNLILGVASGVRGALPEYAKSFQKFRSVPEIFEFFENFFYYR